MAKALAPTTVKVDCKGFGKTGKVESLRVNIHRGQKGMTTSTADQLLLFSQLKVTLTIDKLGQDDVDDQMSMVSDMQSIEFVCDTASVGLGRDHYGVTLSVPESACPDGLGDFAGKRATMKFVRMGAVSKEDEKKKDNYEDPAT